MTVHWSREVWHHDGNCTRQDGFQQSLWLVNCRQRVATRFDSRVVSFPVDCRSSNASTLVEFSSMIEPLLGTPIALILLEC